MKSKKIKKAKKNKAKKYINERVGNASKAEFAAIITHPASSLKNKTGSWRTLKPVALTKKCLGCGTCAKFCPDGAIKIVKGKAKINYDYCKGCGICALECPAKAIIMQQEEK